MNHPRSIWHQFDFVLFGISLLLTAFGIMMIHSATLNAIDTDLINRVPDQIRFGILGFIVLFGLAAVDYRLLGGLHQWLYLVMVGLLILVTFFGVEGAALVILDACRELRTEPSIIKKLAFSTANDAISARAENRLAVSRELYDAAIDRSPHGRTFVYSCSINETAADQPSFSRILIGEGESLATRATGPQTISIRVAFDSTSAVIQKTFKQKQTPVYDGGRRLTHLPFSVSV